MKALDSVVSQVSILTDEELAEYICELERAYVHLLIEAALRGTTIDAATRLGGIVKRLRPV